MAPTPADARRLGGRGLLAAAAERPGLWSSPFADLLPDALAHTLGLDLRLVRPDPHTTGAVIVTELHPGGTGGTLHLAYNGSDHYDALVPVAPEPVSEPETGTGPKSDPGAKPGPETESEPDPAPGTESEPDPVAPPVPPLTSQPDGSDPFGEWLRSMAGLTGPDDAETPTGATRCRWRPNSNGTDPPVS